MRMRTLVCLMAVCLLGLTERLEAQVPRVQITGARIGFSAAENRPRRVKTGLWAPLYVDVRVGNERLNSGEYELVVETIDAEDLHNIYVERRFLPTLEAKESAMLQTFARPGKSDSDIVVTIRRRNSVTVLARTELKTRGGNVNDYVPLEPNLFVYLTLGGPLSGMKRALAQKVQNPLNIEGGEEIEPEENWVRRFAHADDVALLPTSWFGYQAVDAVVFASGSEKFVSDLNRDNDDQIKARLDALAEWVRRGGRLVISVAHNHQHVNAILEKLKVIDVQVRGQIPGLAAVNGFQKWTGGGTGSLTAGPGGTLEVANLAAGKGVRVVAGINNAPPTPNESPLILSAPYGLGRVMVVGVDVDLTPFTAWRGQRNFWDTLRRELEPPNLEGQNNPNQAMRGFGQQAQELATRLQDGMELFPDVPVISFGWVALFIIVYIIIVGPLDYFFLKKVVKRLELTWITFPTVVIVISAVAYFAAYYLKGNDLRINKVDIVDLDLHGSRLHGTTWFTLFSPRIQNYTIGIEPNMPAWGKETDIKEGKSRKEDWSKERYAPLVGWLGKPENVFGGTGRSGSGGLFRRAYDYAPESTGLIGVPIQVWTTKSFGASYDRSVGQKELIEADLRFTKAQQNRVGGTIVSHLPVELHDVVLFYAGNAFKLDKLIPDEKIILDQKNIVAGGQGEVALQTWFSEGFWKQNMSTAPQRQQRFGGMNQPAQPAGMFVKSILFHGHPNDASSSQLHNSTLRSLDQRWRLDRNNREEVILFGRAVPLQGGPTEGAAETILEGGYSPTRLWLGALPEGKEGNPRPSVAGTLSQETYVRVFIPVAPQ